MQSLCTLRNHCRQWPRNTRYQAGRYPLLGPDFHRPDRTSLRLAHSFDHLVGAGKQHRRDFEPGAPSRPEVDHQLELRGLDDWQIGRLGTFEYATRVDADQAVRLCVAWSVARQATGLRSLAPTVESRNPMVVGKRHNLVAPTVQEWIRVQKQR